MSQDVVIHEKRDGYSVITLNRPDRLNSFNEAQHLALRAVLEECEQDADCGAVLLTGAGRGFCAGQDLSDRDPAMMGERPDLGKTLENFYNPLVRKLRAMEKPVVCAVNGVAAGAGANIAFSCDIVLAAKSAKFIQAFSKIALIPDAGGTYWLTRHLGEARAKALALTAEPLSAEDAANWGLIWKAVDDDQLMDEAVKLVEAFAKGPTNAYALTKKAIHEASSNSLDAQLDAERKYQREAGMSDDYKEGVAAFLQKRPADFRAARKT
ncbi:MAG: 2-(1,2-epoxy-1,2-dihydrophenyl)acetyl-CoA isomerase PaaG [Aliihoeflea sp.]|uniref:2-(1,2-epoxy-1,2-dihydrophenyl)acetyl-CoA isomerase PaaG n=1 Tax=Aliihoeflea sp. 40Bstr573 TaxID=2696467 RepID=UPI0020943593|nr:2-(1,2-epoxy-1,2-dihydrophenyl)acetyl-CoA isomerase PaaG [Aliihoeflea sp. 40Bstr573]MCO6388293.1 2-(1,2-epoxy-1,2-dihydrophenyl)acetyl-CoA isomerase [Aliihoeflea sp. 40Bstr573]